MNVFLGEIVSYIVKFYNNYIHSVFRVVETSESGVCLSIRIQKSFDTFEVDLGIFFARRNKRTLKTEQNKSLQIDYNQNQEFPLFYGMCSI